MQSDSEPGRRIVRLTLALLCVCGAIWLIITVVTAIADGKGHGGVFWTSIGVLVLLTFGLGYSAKQLGRRYSK